LSCIAAPLDPILTETHEIGGHVTRIPRAASWALAILLAVLFVLIGASKLGMPSAVRWGARFARWGYPAGTERVVGMLEIAGGIGLLVPKGRRVAGAVLIAIMIGALLTHLRHAEVPRLIPPLVLGWALAALMTRPKHRSDVK
jgi:putative oxidoreductase